MSNVLLGMALHEICFGVDTESLACVDGTETRLRAIGSLGRIDCSCVELSIASSGEGIDEGINFIWSIITSPRVSFLVSDLQKCLISFNSSKYVQLLTFAAPRINLRGDFPAEVMTSCFGSEGEYK